MKNGKYYSNHVTPKELDKLVELRKKLDWIQSITNSDSAFVIPIKNDEVFITKSKPRDFALLQSPVDKSEVYLLGKYENKYLFTQNITDEYFEDNKNLFSSGVFYNIRFVALMLNAESSAILNLARQIVEWNTSNKYCGKCGTTTTSFDGGLSRVCANTACQKQIFPKLSPAVIVLVTNNDKVLLGRQPLWPEGMHSTLAGFVEPAEKIEDTVRREILEESGINVDKIKYFGSQPWPFPDSLMLGFTAEAINTNIQIDNDELENAEWFSREDIKAGLSSGNFKMPMKISIAFRLIESWFDEIEGYSLAELID